MNVGRNSPIGVFDSGLGGLTIVKAIQKLLPNEKIIYLGDTARLPYGTKSKRQIINFSIQNSDFLLSKGVKAIVVACNSSSANAYAVLKRRLNIPIVDVIGPASLAALESTVNKKIGVIGTTATIKTKSYEHRINKRKGYKVYSTSCPLFVPLVEEGWLNDKITCDIISRYLSKLKAKNIDTLILGCTHYPLLKRLISKEMRGVTIIDSGPKTAELIKKELARLNLLSLSHKEGSLKLFLTDFSQNFLKIGERFLGNEFNHVKVINI